MSFESDLGGAHRCKSIDHSESVSSTRRDCEHFQGRVGHEASVRVSELTLSVNQYVFGILPGVDGQTTWVSLGCVFVKPIAEKHDMSGQVVVVQVTVGVFGRRLTDDNASVQTVKLLKSSVSVPEVGTRVTLPLISVIICKEF